MTSSDAMKNSPFILAASSAEGGTISFIPNDTFAKSYAKKGANDRINVIKIPKSLVGFVTVGKYKLSEDINHMPMVRRVKSISRASGPPLIPIFQNGRTVT